nr:cytochrome P450 720B39 [Ginkgo biloba]
MAENTLISLLLGIFGFMIIAAVQLIYRKCRSPKLYNQSAESTHEKLPPGSMGWPLIGETISWYLCMSNNLPNKFVEERLSWYGDIFRSHLFGKRVIVSVDPHFNKFMLQNEGRLFQAHYSKPTVNLFGKYGIISIRGELHKKLHGIAVNLLTSEKLRVDFLEDIQTLLHNTLRTWEGKDILLQEECHRMILNMMAKQLLDLSPSRETDDIAAHFHNFSAAVLSIPVKIPGSTYARGFKARTFLLKKIYETMEQRRKHPQVVHNDLLTKLLNEGSLSDEIVADFLLFMLFAGHETSSRSMALAIKFLTDCPRALEQLIEEHEGIQKRKLNNEKLSWDDYKSMKFTQCVINETLRLSSITPGLLREAIEDIKVKGYLIPKGWAILGLTIGVHLNEKYFSEALEFNPWRWQANGQEDQISDETLLVPFGGGARLCPGAQLARLEVSLFLHHFVSKFRWKVLEVDRISHFPFAHLVGGFPIQLHHKE